MKASNNPWNLGLEGRRPIIEPIICPTRELASQSVIEANYTLMTYHEGMDVHFVIGGTNIKSKATNLERLPYQVGWLSQIK